MNNQEYFNKRDHISSSLLVALSNHPKEVKAMIDGERKETTEAMSFGSLLDVKLTEPHKVDEIYRVSTATIPTDKMLIFADKVIEVAIQKDKTVDELLESGEFYQIVLDARKEVGYDSRLADKTVFDRFVGASNSYCVEALQANKDNKILISMENDILSDTLVQRIKEHPQTSYLFTSEDRKDIEVKFQVEIYTTIFGAYAKALLDFIVIDHVDKTITPYDLKSYEGKFLSNFYKYKYYYQAGWYSLLLENIKKEWGLDDYTVERFHFLAVDKSLYRDIEIYTLSKEVIEDIQKGGKVSECGSYTVTKDGKKSIVSLVSELVERMHQDNWLEVWEMWVIGEIPIAFYKE